MIYPDLELAQKLESTEAKANRAFINARNIFEGNKKATWIELGGTYALFDGIDSPMTQTFGLGLFDSFADSKLSLIENFFKEQKAPVNHEVSPLADPSLMPLLNQRGYQPCELTNVLFTPVSEASVPHVGNIKTRIIKNGEEKPWAKASMRGWLSGDQVIDDSMLDFGVISASTAGGFAFVAEFADQIIATGMLYIFDDMALLGGASTVPEHRGRGAQTALLKARLDFARIHGCKMAMMCASPGSQSQRNAMKNRFQVAYTRTKWLLK